MWNFIGLKSEIRLRDKVQCPLSCLGARKLMNLWMSNVSKARHFNTSLTAISHRRFQREGCRWRKAVYLEASSLSRVLQAFIIVIMKVTHTLVSFPIRVPSDANRDVGCWQWTGHSMQIWNYALLLLTKQERNDIWNDLNNIFIFISIKMKNKNSSNNKINKAYFPY
jgi:hypothetical protein